MSFAIEPTRGKCMNVRMTLTIIDEKNSVVLEYPYDGKCKYPPIKE